MLYTLLDKVSRIQNQSHISRLIDINDFIYLKWLYKLHFANMGSYMIQFPHLINGKIEWYLLIDFILGSSYIDFSKLLSHAF